MKRKSPIRHIVRTHLRRTPSGKRTTVHQYERGHGKRKPKISNPTPRKTNKQLSNFTVTLSYANNPQETFTVQATNYPEAIEYGLLSRLHITPPSRIEVAKH